MSFYTQFKPTAGVQKIFAGTGTAVSTSTGIVTIWTTATATISNLQDITNNGNTTTNAIYAAELYDNGARVITTATIGLFEAGVLEIQAGTDISVNTTTGIVTVSNVSTLESVTTRGATSSNPITITNTTASTGTDTGALIVDGGVGIGGDVYLGGVLHAREISSIGVFTASPQLIVKSDSLDPASSATIVINSTVPVGFSALTIQNTGASGRSYTIDVGGNNRALTGGTSINEGNLTIYDDIDDAYRLILTKTGNLLVGTETDTGAKLIVNGAIAVSTGTFAGPIIVQTSLVETTISEVNTTDTTEIDKFDSASYRSCKCFVQVEDNGNYHLTEIVLLHDDIGQVYKSEYGIISTGGEKGLFTADLQLDGMVRLYFTADAVSDKKIKVIKTALAV